jgi:hypothetical protein
VRCRAYKDGWFEVGIKFNNLADEEQINSAGAEGEAGAAAAAPAPVSAGEKAAAAKRAGAKK